MIIIKTKKTRLKPCQYVKITHRQGTYFVGMDQKGKQVKVSIYEIHLDYLQMLQDL